MGFPLPRHIAAHFSRLGRLRDATCSRLTGVVVVTEQTSSNSLAERAQELPSEPDAHGQTAMLLVESLIHRLISQSVITVADALELIAIAAEVEEELASNAPDPNETMRRSAALLESIRCSLSIDLAPE